MLSVVYDGGILCTIKAIKSRTNLGLNGLDAWYMLNCAA